MKRLIQLLMAGIVVLSVTACGENAPTEPKATETETTAVQPAAKEETPAVESKVEEAAPATEAIHEESAPATTEEKQ